MIYSLYRELKVKFRPVDAIFSCSFAKKKRTIKINDFKKTSQTEINDDLSVFDMI